MGGNKNLMWGGGGSTGGDFSGGVCGGDEQIFDRKGGVPPSPQQAGKTLVYVVGIRITSKYLSRKCNWYQTEQ